MSGGTTHRFRLPRGRGEARQAPQETVQAPSPFAMRIALAHYVERCVEDGTLASYAEAADRLGITRARMTQVQDLLLLTRPKMLCILHESTPS